MIIDKSKLLAAVALSGLAYAIASPDYSGSAFAQDQQTAAATPAAGDQAAQPEAPAPLTDDELEVLVARIALYPDELIAVVAAASLYPLQIVEAQRFLEESKTKKDLKPKSTWDGSVVSLMNYPEVVKMMSDDLDWTQSLGEAITYQQKDVLDAIQQLREKAVAEGIIKTDEKVKVTEEEDNIVIEPASSEVIYVPQYEPAMLYDDAYPAQPIYYYPDPYPPYYYPWAPFFAGAIVGGIWGGFVDWDDGIWGGSGWGNDIDIDCKNCFNDIDGKFNAGDVDWRNVDRDKINQLDRDKFKNIDKSKFKNDLKARDNNNIGNKARDVQKNRPSTRPAGGGQVKDVRASTLEGLKKQPGSRPAQGANRPSQGGGANVTRPGQGNKGPGAKVDRPSGKAKPGGKVDNRSRNPSPMGEVNRGKKTKAQSNRGGKSMGGGISGPPKRRPMPRGGGGGRGGGRGGGGGRR